MANASYNTYQSPIDRAQAIRGGRLANETRQIQNDTAGINNQKQRRAVEEYDRTLKTTTLARDSYELLNAAPEMREQLIKGYAAKDQTGFWAGGAGKSSEELQQMLEMNVNRGQQIGVFGEAPEKSAAYRQYLEGKKDPGFAASQEEAPKDTRSPEKILYDESLENPAFGASLKKPEPARKIVKGADGFNYYEDTQERVLPGVEQAKSESQSATDDKVALFESIGLSNEESIKHALNKIQLSPDPVNGLPSIIDLTTSEQRPVDSITMTALTQSLPDDDSIIESDGQNKSQNIYNRIDSGTTGLMASTKEWLEERVGQISGVNIQADKDMQIRQDLKMLQRQLVLSMIEGRFSATQMKAIEEDIDMSSSPLKGERTMKANLISIDKNLRKRLAAMRTKAKNRYTTPMPRADAFAQQKVINDFLRDLAVPQDGLQKVSTDDTPQPNASTAQPQANESAPEGIDPEDWKYVSPEDRKSILESRSK